MTTTARKDDGLPLASGPRDYGGTKPTAPDRPTADRVPWLVSLGAAGGGLVTVAGFQLWAPAVPLPLICGGLLLVCTLAPAVLWARAAERARREAALHAARLAALAEALPVPACIWFSDRPDVPVRNGRGDSFVRQTDQTDLRAAFGAALGPQPQPEPVNQANRSASGTGLGGAVDSLRSRGTAFRRDVTDERGRTFRLLGARGGPGGNAEPSEGIRAACVLAFDRSADGQARAAAEARARHLQTALDAAPWPIWMRGADLRMLLCNQAYARAVEADVEAVLADQRELVSGTVSADDARAVARAALAEGRPQRAHRRVVVDGNRRLLEVIESPLTDAGRAAGGGEVGAAPAQTPVRGLGARPGPGAGPETGAGTGPALVGFAVDRTREDELTAEMERHIEAHSAVLEQLGSAIAIYGPDTRLQFYNRAYANLWDLSDAWLSAKPSFGEVLEELRTRRRLPEHADFPMHKRQSLSLFTTLIDAAEDLMHLPDGTTLRSLVVPHPFGGLMFVLEDVTNSLALESSYNTLVAVQRETLDNLAEGIAVFGGDGRLKLSNPAYEAIWGLRSDDVVGEPHVTALLDRIKHFFDYGDDWESFRSDMVAATLDRAARQGRIARIDGSVIEFSHVPLPDGAVLTSYLDVSDSARVEKALHAANAALEAADALKLGLLTNLSYHLRTPLTAILGYAEMLALEVSGPLTRRQASGLGHILEAGRELLALTEDILDLATLEAGYVGIETRPVPLQDLLHRSLAAGRSMAGGPEAPVLALDPALQDGLSVEADEARLIQALSNLIAVALRYPPRDGNPVLSVRQEEDQVHLSLPIGHKSHLGRQDGRAGPPDTGSAAAGVGGAGGGGGRSGGVRRQPTPTDPSGVSGLGIGLTVARRLIERHGGRVELHAAGQDEMTIRCVLPVQTAQPDLIKPGL